MTETIEVSEWSKHEFLEIKIQMPGSLSKEEIKRFIGLLKKEWLIVQVYKIWATDGEYVERAKSEVKP
jgi:hypothetical protein